MTGPTDNRQARYAPSDDERANSDKNRRFGAALRKLYRESLEEPLSDDLKDALDKLE